MIDHLEAVIAELEERIDEMEDTGVSEAEIEPLRERLALYEARAEEEDMGHWFSHSAFEA